MFSSLKKRLVSATLAVSVLFSLVPAFAEEYQQVDFISEDELTTIPGPTEIPENSISAVNSESVVFEDNEYIEEPDLSGKNIEEKAYERFEIEPFHNVLSVATGELSMSSGTMDSQKEIVVDDMQDLSRNQGSEVMSLSTSGVEDDTIYSIDMLYANKYNKKIDGELSVSSANGNVMYSYTVADIPGKNGLNLSLEIQHNSLKSIPIIICAEETDPGISVNSPIYYPKYNERMGSGWEFSGIKRKDPNIIYIETRDGRLIYKDLKRFADVECSFASEEHCYILNYKDGTIEKISDIGYLKSIEDKYGNKINYIYDEEDNLISVSDSNGNVISITYTDEYIEITKPDNNKIRLILSELEIRNIGQAYGFDETMTVNVISSIYDVTQNKTIAGFEYSSHEILYSSFWESGADEYLVNRDRGVFVTISKYNSPYTGIQSIDYTELAIGLVPEYNTLSNRLNAYMAAEKYYTGNSTIPQKTYSYRLKPSYLSEKESSGGRYIEVSELTADGKLTVTEVNKPMFRDAEAAGDSKKIYERTNGADILLSETLTEYFKYPATYMYDSLRPKNVINKIYNADGDYITTETTYEYDYNDAIFDSYGKVISAVTSVDGVVKNEITNQYYGNKYRSLKKTEISNNDIVDISTVYTVNALGDITNEKTYEGDDSGTIVKDVCYTYDTNNNLAKTEVLDEENVLSSVEYGYSDDGVYMTSQYSKNSDGDILLQETYTYDDMGNILSVTNANGTESFDYDSLGRVTKEIHPDSSAKTISYNEIDRSIVVTDELSRVVEYFYDSTGLPQYIEQRTPEYSSYDMYYDTMGNLNRVNDRRGYNTYITSDIFGRQTKVVYPSLSSSEEEATEAKYYDVFFDGTSKCSVKIIISQTGKISCEYYDLYGRVYKTALIENHDDFTAADFDGITAMPAAAELVITGRYVYDNFDRVIEEYDGENRKTVYTYDVLGNVLSATTGTGDKALTVTYEYDAAGRCIKMTQGGDHITQYEYNEAGQLVKTTDPMGYTEIYTYDTAGNVLTQKDKNGVITTNTYDSLGRVTKTQRLTKSIDYTYDALGNILTSTDENGTITYQYNADGTLYKKTYPDGKYITYDSYDLDDRVTQFTDYFGKTIQQSYNARGLVSSISENYSGADTVKTTTYDYYSDGALKKATIPNQETATQYTYNYAGSISDVRNINVNNGCIHNSHTYTYDNSGYITAKSDYVAGVSRTVNYGYDTAGRLLQERVGSETLIIYSYDAYNNIESEMGSVNRTYTYDKNNRLIKMQETNAYADTADGEMLGNWQTDYVYDKNGKLLNSSKYYDVYDSNQKSYSYDTFGRLVQFDDDLGVNADYTYYSDGLRKSKTIGSNTLTYYYNGDNLINESLNGSNTTSYLMGADGYICRKRSTAYEYYLKDAHGDVVYGMNQNGGRIGQYSYNAWGEYETEYSYYSEIYRSPIRYSGQYYDYESGMTYLRARYYDPQLRRFISEDPIQDGFNWYAYCGNNPVMFVDPWGLEISDEEMTMYENGEMSPGAYSFLMVCTYYYYLEDTDEGKAWWSEQEQNFRDSGYTDTGNDYWNWVISEMSSRPSGEITSDEHFFRNNLNIQFSWTNFQKLNARLPDKFKWKELSFGKSIFHKFDVKDFEAMPQGNNRKYVSACEHFEVVYTKENYLVDEEFSSTYMGTYNYYGPTQIDQHNKYDVEPYLDYGNVP